MAEQRLDTNWNAMLGGQPVNSIDDALHEVGATRLNGQDVSKAQKLCELCARGPADIQNDEYLRQLVGGSNVNVRTNEQGETVITGSNGTTVTIIPQPGNPNQTAAIVVNDGAGNSTVAFRGTQGAADHARNRRFALANGPDGTRVHTGFNESAEALRERVNAATTGSTRVDYVGHSAGGAIAMIFAARAPETQTTNVITFGAPRVGDRRFEDLVRERTGGNIARIVNNRDGVPGTGLGAHGTRPIITDGTNLSVGDRPDAPGAFVQTLVNFATNRMLAVGHHRIGSGYGSLGPNPPDGPPAITPHEPPLTGGSRLNGLQRLAASCSKFCHDRAATCRFGWSQNLFQSIAVGIERLAGLSPSAGGSNPPGNNVERGG